MLSGLFDNKQKPLFLNEGAFHSELVLQKMEALRSVVDERDAERLERDIALAKSGIVGEKRVAFELKNAHYPLVFLHDLNLEHEGATAQIDFLVISPYNAFVLECKNLVGDIKVQRDGSFIRTFESGARRRREAIYSPVTQNARHVELMKAIIRAENGKLISGLIAGMLDSYFHSVVVLANDKTVVSMTGAPAEVRRRVVRLDALVDHIKKADQVSKKTSERDSFTRMQRSAQGWLKRSKPLQVDLAGKYAIKPVRNEADGSEAQGQSESVQQGEVPICPVCGSPMQLRTARHGAHKGQQFWGCSTYWATRCPGIVEVEGR